jgi:hypothetical protein
MAPPLRSSQFMQQCVCMHDVSGIGISDLGGATAASEADHGDQADANKPKRLKTNIAELKEELEDAEERLRDLEK